MPGRISWLSLPPPPPPPARSMSAALAMRECFACDILRGSVMFVVV
jgi:hypothetical protein